jgi:DNA-binding NarL/FixJ family response regulator
MTDEILRVQRILNYKIGELKISQMERRQLRELTFELIDIEDQLVNFSEIALRSKVSKFNARAIKSGAKLNFKANSSQPSAKLKAKLTRKELEVLAQLPKGLSIAQLSAALYLSESTVKTHLSAIYRKLEVSNRVQALAKAREYNLLTI